MKKLFWTTALLICMYGATHSQSTAQNFELFYFTDSTIANGFNGFHGDSSFFSVEQRIEGLEKYATFAKDFYGDYELETFPWNETEQNTIKSQLLEHPNPTVRKQQALEEWQWTIDQSKPIEAQEQELQEWAKDGEGIVQDGALIAQQTYRYAKELETPQDWRFSLEWEVKVPNIQERSAFLLLDEESNPVVLIGITAEGGCFYKSRLGLPIGIGDFQSDTLINFKLFVDIEASRFSLYLNNELKADFVRALSSNAIHKFFVQIPKGGYFDNLYGVSYDKTKIEPEKGRYPSPTGSVFLEERFEVIEPVGDISKSDLSKTNWKNLSLPIHSGDRYRKNDILLRKRFTPLATTGAVLKFTHLSKGAEVWLNRSIVHVQRNNGDATVDVSEDLVANQENELIIRLKGGKGWFLQAAHLEYIPQIALSDISFTVDSITDNVYLRLTGLLEATSMPSSNGFWGGTVDVKIYPYYPNASNTPIVESAVPITARLYRPEPFQFNLVLSNLQFWSPQQTPLYQIVVSAARKDGTSFDAMKQDAVSVDDYTFYTGFKTIEQANGKLVLNSDSIQLFGVNLSDFLPFAVNTDGTPSDPTDEYLIKNILTLKTMGANVIRTPLQDNIDIRRLATICDQLGILLIVQTGSSDANNAPWRTTATYVQKVIEMLKHHPSVIIWQATDDLVFNDFNSDALSWMRYYQAAIKELDNSRLIVPYGSNADFGNAGVPNVEGNRLYDATRRRARFLSDATAWRNTTVVHGASDKSIGTGNDWNSLTSFPSSVNWDTLKIAYLKDSIQAYLEFNTDFFAGQENPTAVGGVPYRYSEVYESPYVQDYIGKALTFDDWEVSQALQALLIQASIKKRRQLGYDGILYNRLWNGADPTALLDAVGHAKLGFYAFQSSIQKEYAAAATADIAWENGAEIPVFLSADRPKTVIAELKDENGKTLQSQRLSFSSSDEFGNFITTWQPSAPSEGWYFVVYRIVN